MTDFVDDFNRADGPVGNGWLDTTGDLNATLVIVGGSVTTSSGGSVAGMYRPVDLTVPIVVSADITQISGFGGVLERYYTNFLFGNDGTLSDGYGINVYRGDANYSDSAVNLIYNGAIVGTVLSTFQFGESPLHVSIEYMPDGSLSGSVTEGASSFTFDFAAQAVQLSGTDFAIVQGGPDTRSSSLTFPTIDNVNIDQIENSPPVASPDFALVQKGGIVSADAAHGVLLNDSDPDGDGLSVTAVDGSAVAVGHAIAGAYGTLTLNGDGSYTYAAKASLPANQSLVDVFNYSVSDGHGHSATSTLDISIVNSTAPQQSPHALTADQLISYVDITPGDPTPQDVVNAARQHIGELWTNDLCTGLVWAVSYEVGAPFFDQNMVAPDGVHVLNTNYDVPHKFGLDLGPNPPNAAWNHWETVAVTADWESVVQPGDLVRVYYPGDTSELLLGKSHSFIVTKIVGGEIWVIDNTRSALNPNPNANGDVTIAEHTFNLNSTFGKEVLHPEIAYVDRLEPGGAPPPDSLVALVGSSQGNMPPVHDSHFS